MLPQGTIWQRLRQKALSTTPDGTLIRYSAPSTLREWMSSGSFSVTSATSQRFTLSASPVEVGGVLFSESALYLDHAAEHSVTVRHQLSSGRWYSAAWVSVTLYYWAFFLALSISRMLGQTGLFVTKIDASKLRLLFGGSGALPGAGPYVFECGSQQTLSQIDVTLRRASNTRLHELVWRLLFDEIRAAALEGRNVGTDQAEMRLFNALEQSANRLGSSWPSDLRNLANYSPGLAYGAVRRKQIIGVFGSILVNQPATFAQGLDELENNVNALSNCRSAGDDPKAAAKMLISLTFALDSLARELHSDVVGRRRIDRRWSNFRKEFFEGQFSNYPAGDWPFAA